MTYLTEYRRVDSSDEAQRVGSPDSVQQDDPAAKVKSDGTPDKSAE